MVKKKLTLPRNRLSPRRRTSGPASPLASSTSGTELRHSPEDVVTVPNPEDMDDETFLKHIDKRHRQDTKHNGDNVLFPKSTWTAWVPLYRSWHERLHAISLPGQYDHEHLKPAYLEGEEE
jgi:hypothetical protein